MTLRTHRVTLPQRPSGVDCSNTWPYAPATTIFEKNDYPALPNEFDGDDLVVGLRFRMARACTITAVRYFRAIYESGDNTAYIYSYPGGRRVSSFGPIRNDQCFGPRWVTVYLDQPIRATPGAEYVAAVDSVHYYPKTINYDFSSRSDGPVTPVQGVYGFHPGSMPSTSLDVSVNYWLDGKLTSLRGTSTAMSAY